MHSNFLFFNMFLFLFPYVTFQTKFVSSLGYQSLSISGTETLYFDLSYSYTIVAAFSKSSSWRTPDGSQLQPVYKNPSSITISSSTESYIYFTVFQISSRDCDFVDIIIDGPTSYTYTLTDSDLSNGKQYCLLFHYMNTMKYNLYRSSSTESYDKLYYSTSCDVTGSMYIVSNQFQLSYNSIAIRIEMDSSNIKSGTEMGVSSISGTNSYTGDLYSVPGYSAKFSPGSGTGSVTSSLTAGDNSISISSTPKTYLVSSGYLLVFPDSNSYVNGLAEVDTKSLSILSNTGIKSVYFKEAGTVTLYSNSGIRSIHVIVFNDYLYIENCDEVIVANKIDFTVHTKQSLITCIYIAPVDGSVKVDTDSPSNFYYYASGGYNNLYSKTTTYDPIQVKISDSSKKTKFEISDGSYYSYKLLIRNGTNTNKTYSISSSSYKNLNSNDPKDSPSNNYISVGLIVGIISSILAIIAIIIVVICCCCCGCIKLCKSTRRYTTSSSSTSSSRSGVLVGGSPSPTPSGQSQPQMYQQWNQNQQQQTASYPPPSSQPYPPPYNSPSPASNAPSPYNPPQYAPPPASNAPPPYNPPQYAPPPASNAPPPYSPPQYAPPPIDPAPPAAQDNYENPYA